MHALWIMLVWCRFCVLERAWHAASVAWACAFERARFANEQSGVLLACNLMPCVMQCPSMHRRAACGCWHAGCIQRCTAGMQACLGCMQPLLWVQKQYFRVFLHAAYCCWHNSFLAFLQRLSCPHVRLGLKACLHVMQCNQAVA